MLFFLTHLPTQVRSILAVQDFATIQDLAKAANRIVEAQNNFHTVVSAASATRQPLRFHQAQVAKPKQSRENFICSYHHQRFGPDARNCRPGCLFAKLLSSRQASKQQHQENANASRQWLQRSADIQTVLCRCGIALKEYIFLLIVVPMFVFSSSHTKQKTTSFRSFNSR